MRLRNRLARRARNDAKKGSAAAWEFNEVGAAAISSQALRVSFNPWSQTRCRKPRCGLACGHELNEMATSFTRIKNYNVSVKELGKKIIFLRKLVPGGSEHSFGIHVAKMAGMPRSIVERAAHILTQLEQKSI